MSGSTYSANSLSASAVAEEAANRRSDAGIGRSQSYPQLKRLCNDFGLQVSEPLQEGVGVCRESFGLVERQSEAERCLTPFFPSMSQLEAFVAANLVDILHDYFFGEHQSVHG